MLSQIGITVWELWEIECNYNNFYTKSFGKISNSFLRVDAVCPKFNCVGDTISVGCSLHKFCKFGNTDDKYLKSTNFSKLKKYFVTFLSFYMNELNGDDFKILRT